MAFDSRTRGFTLLILVGFGVAFGALALTFAVWQAAGGHGSYLPAKLLFPFSMLSSVLSGHVDAVGIVFALCQWPIYGAIVGGVPAPKRHKALVALALIHATAVVTCFQFVNPEIFH